MATKKAAAKKSVATKSMPRGGRNPEGGLTAKGRAYFAAKDGSHLKAGVTDAADTPEKMKRKGSFLVRTFTHPRGPMVDAKGEPTRLALSAHAWGESVPKTMSAAHTLAAKGHTLLSKYHAAQEKAAKKSPAVTPAAKKSAKKAVVKKAAAKGQSKSSR